MITCSSVTVFVSYIVDGVGLAILTDIGVGSLDNVAFLISSCVFKLARFLLEDFVFCLETVNKNLHEIQKYEMNLKKGR